jgi:hypothetical protein
MMAGGELLTDERVSNLDLDPVTYRPKPKPKAEPVDVDADLPKPTPRDVLKAQYARIRAAETQRADEARAAREAAQTDE